MAVLASPALQCPEPACTLPAPAHPGNQPPEEHHTRQIPCPWMGRCDRDSERCLPSLQVPQHATVDTGFTEPPSAKFSLFKFFFLLPRPPHQVTTMDRTLQQTGPRCAALRVVHRMRPEKGQRGSLWVGCRSLDSVFANVLDSADHHPHTRTPDFQVEPTLIAQHPSSHL